MKIKRQKTNHLSGFVSISSAKAFPLEIIFFYNETSDSRDSPKKLVSLAN